MTALSGGGRPIALTSVSIVFTVAVCTWIGIYTDDQSPPASGDVLARQPDPRAFLVAYGIIAFQFDIHPMLLTLQVDMKDGRRVHSAVLAGFAVTGAMFAVTALLAASRYGSHVQTNILQGMPPSVSLYVVALLVTLQLCLSSAVGNSAMFQHVEDLLRIPKEFGFKRCLLRSSIIILGVFLGESVPRFDLVMGLVGSTLTGPLMFIFPPLFFLKLCFVKARRTEESLPLLSYTKKDQLFSNSKQNGGSHQNGGSCQNGGDLSDFPLVYHNALHSEMTYRSRYEPDDEYAVRWYDVVLAVLVMVMGVVATVAASYSSWSDAISSETFSQPCLVNATAAARSFFLSTQSS